jgi:AraC-like DNA-binding protein
MSALPVPALASLPPPGRARVAGAYARTAVDTALALGADAARLGRACGLPALDQGLPEWLPVRQYLGLLDAAARQLDEPAFGLRVGQRMRLATYVGYGVVLCTCTDFRAAADQTARFEGLAHDLGRSELGGEGGVAHFRWHSPWLAQPGGRHLAESVMAGIRVFADWLAGEALPVIELRFTHARPAELPLQVYEQVFGAPVHFGAAVTEARFPQAVLGRPVPSADASLFPALARLAQQRLAARQRDALEPPLVREVRDRIRTRLMHDEAGLDDVAQALGLPARTLQRRLAQAGASFSALLDGVRRELAQQHLADRRLSMTEIAFLLGFRQQSSFNHAFRAWFGCTPAAWRARHADADADAETAAAADIADIADAGMG